MDTFLYLKISNDLVKIKLINNRELKRTIYAIEQLTLVAQTLLTQALTGFM